MEEENSKEEEVYPAEEQGIEPKETSEEIDDDMETGEKEYSLTTFTFDRKKLTGFWVDNPEDIDGETGVRDIAFYVDGYYFRTPYHEEKEKMFNKIIEDNEQA